MDGDHLTLTDVHTAFSEAWTADTVLVVSADQFQMWLAKLYESRGRDAPPKLPLLRPLRNSVIHLEHASIDEESWVATPANSHSERTGIGRLPGGELAIAIGSSSKVLGVIEEGEIETYIDHLLAELAAELDDYAQDWLSEVARGR